MLTKDNNVIVENIDLRANRIDGYFAEFKTVDSYGEVTQKGAFSKTIAENGPQGKNLIRWCMNHNMVDSLGSLIELKEDDFGLFYSGQLGDMFWANELRKMIDCGINIRHSFGYYTMNSHKDGGVTYLTEVKMLEGSCLNTWAANENTPIVAVKSDNSIKDNVREFNAAIAPYMKYKSISEATDESIKSVEDWIKEQEDGFYKSLEQKVTEEKQKDIEVMAALEMLRWK